MKKVLGIMMAFTISCSVGCAGPGSNTVPGNVATGATINALAGVPGAGLVAAAAIAVEALTKPRSNKGGVSPELVKLVEEAPSFNLACKNSKELVCKDEELEVVWRSRKRKDGSLVTVESAPKRSLEYTESLGRAARKYWAGILGDTPEMQAKNLKAREEGTTVVAEYHGPNNANIVYESVNNGPVYVMTGEEWAARNAAGAAEKSVDLKDPTSVPADKPVDTKGSASNFIDKAGDLKEPNGKN
jgi:hypothetical protein